MNDERLQSQAAEGGGDQVPLQLPYQPPLGWQNLVRFLAPRATPGIEVVSQESYCRTIELNGQAGMIAVGPSADRDTLDLRIQLAHTRRLRRIREQVSALFDLGAAPATITRHLSQDPLLRPLVQAQAGLRVPGAWHGFELCVRAILGQQVSVKGATTLAGRLALRFGAPLPFRLIDTKGQLSRLFPSPAALADADIGSIGLPQARALTIKRLAQAVCRGDLSFDPSQALETFVERITQIKGIGDWTAHYVAMRALKHADAFPAADLGLLKAVQQRMQKKVSTGELLKIAEAWRPWRAYAAMVLWNSLQ